MVGKTPIPLEKPFVERSVTMYLTSSENGNLYFTTGEKGDKPEDWVIYNSINEKGQYRSIKRMGKEINFSGNGSLIHTLHLTKAISFMMVKALRDLETMICTSALIKTVPGQKLYNLGPEVNTDQTEMCPSVSPDGKYLFFHRGGEDKGDIYWIDFRPIKERIENINSN